MKVSWNELEEAFEFVSAGQPYEHQAVLCRTTGKIFWHSDYTGDEEESPDDIDEEEGEGKYLAIPHRNELDLGRPLVFDFVRKVLPDAFDEVQAIFSRKGAYGRFRDLLHRRHALKEWNDFEATAAERALREWCERNDVSLRD